MKISSFHLHGSRNSDDHDHDDHGYGGPAEEMFSSLTSQRRLQQPQTLGASEVLNCRFQSRSLQQLQAKQRRRPLDKRLSRQRSEGRATAVQL
ncbi:unnamed protein product [Lota lota]